MASTDEPVRARASAQESGHSRELQRPPLPDPLVGEVVDTLHDIADGTRVPVSGSTTPSRSPHHPHRAVGCDLTSSRWSVAAADANPSVLTTVSLHTNEAPRVFATGGRAAWMRRTTRSRR
jgi:TatD DNase family protein